MASEEALGQTGRLSLRLTQLLAAPKFHEIVAKLPLMRRVSRREGAKIFSVLQGFVASQVVASLIELGVLRRLLAGPMRCSDLARQHGLPEDRFEILLRAAVATRLLKQRRDGRYCLARKGAAILGVPGLEAMIAHHRSFYADMADPVALLRAQGDTELSRFWPYVLGDGAEGDEDASGRYSDLMAESQGLVARDTLAAVSLEGTSRLMDVGGGYGTFLAAALRRHSALQATLVDLPQVLRVADARLAGAGLAERVTLQPLNFRQDALPPGADAISLIRVLYDHDDGTVSELLRKSHAALPPGGRLIVSEPMSGGADPDPVTDVYFAFYTMAMGTGRVRSPDRIGEMCRAAGFDDIRAPRSFRPYIASIVTAVRKN